MGVFDSYSAESPFIIIQKYYWNLVYVKILKHIIYI